MHPESAELAITERLADLLMLSHEPMFAWKLHGGIEFWNTGAERLYGFASNEAVGRSSHSLLQTKHPIELAELRSPTKVELVINLKTAKAFGLTVPPSMLLRADEVIE